MKRYSGVTLDDVVRPAPRAVSLREQRQAEFELELRRRRCDLHASGALCDRCARTLDSLGFPRPDRLDPERTRCRVCPGCRQLVTVDQWDIQGGKDGMCLRCTDQSRARAAAPTVPAARA
jgi:hypothetical protein